MCAQEKVNCTRLICNNFSMADAVFYLEFLYRTMRVFVISWCFGNLFI